MSQCPGKSRVGMQVCLGPLTDVDSFSNWFAIVISWMWVCHCGDALGDLNGRSIRTLVMVVVSFPLTSTPRVA